MRSWHPSSRYELGPTHSDVRERLHNFSVTSLLVPTPHWAGVVGSSTPAMWGLTFHSCDVQGAEGSAG